MKNLDTTECGQHLKSPEDLVNMPTFPEGTKSSVARFVTKDIWNEYRHEQDEAGVPFKTQIFSGCKNLDSGIGCYAGSHNSYYKFAKFYDKVIQDYHNHGP